MSRSAELPLVPRSCRYGVNQPQRSTVVPEGNTVPEVECDQNLVDQRWLAHFAADVLWLMTGRRAEFHIFKHETQMASTQTVLSHGTLGDIHCSLNVTEQFLAIKASAPPSLANEERRNMDCVRFILSAAQ